MYRLMKENKTLHGTNVMNLYMQGKKIDGNDNEQPTHDAITPLQVVSVAHQLTDPGACKSPQGDREKADYQIQAGEDKKPIAQRGLEGGNA